MDQDSTTGRYSHGFGSSGMGLNEILRWTVMDYCPAIIPRLSSFRIT